MAIVSSIGFVLSSTSHPSYRSEAVMRRDYQMLLKSLPLSYWLDPPLVDHAVVSGSYLWVARIFHI